MSVDVLRLAPFLSSADNSLALASIRPSRGSSFRAVIAVAIRKGPIDASVFALLTGYARVASPISVAGSCLSGRK